MGRIADIPDGYWLTCVELGRPATTGRQYIVPSIKGWLDDLRAHPGLEHDPLLSKWKISVTRIDSRVSMENLQAQFRRDDNAFQIQKSFEVDLRELAEEGGFRVVETRSLIN